jgi:lysophospholipase L1-like esterase
MRKTPSALSQEYIDFDTAIGSKTEPSRLDALYAAPDNTHPNINGQKRLARAASEALIQLGLIH